MKKKNHKKEDEEKPSMERIYYNVKHPASFGGKSRLKNHYPRKQVDNWVKSQLTYTLHKPIRKKFPTREYTVSGLNHLWQMDLMEMIPYASINDGYKYVLVCIDVFSRYARALPCKNKTGVEVAHKFDDMLISDGRKLIIPRNVQTDLGKEFYNSQMKELFEKYGMNHYTVNSQFKAAIVERFIRTLRDRLNHYFTYTGRKVWYKILPEIISTYNNSKHSGIFYRTPASITSENEFELWELKEQKKSQSKENSLTKSKVKTEESLHLLDYVRISKISVSQPFNRNFDQNWSDEVFRIVGIDTKAHPLMYILEDESNNVIKGKFYRQELQSLGTEKPKIFRIEAVLKSKGKGIHKQYLVKWHGYSSEHNSWVSASQLQNKNEE